MAFQAPLTVYFSNSIHKMMSWSFPVKVDLIELHKTPYDKSTLGRGMAEYRQVTSHFLNQFEPDKCRHMALLGHNG